MYDNKYCGIPIGNQIRALRTAQGWSLATLAEKIGTSAPTVHRYENGWDRFELATLKRIGSALGARLEVNLIAARDTNQEFGQLSENNFVKLLKPLFWDKALDKTDLEQYPEWVLERVLMFGNRNQVVAARTWFGDDLVLAAASRRGVDKRTSHYWRIVLEGDCGAPEGTG